MKSEVKKFTFDDWRDGNIPVPPYPEGKNSTEFDKLRWMAASGGENRLYFWTETEPPRLSKDEYGRILDKKKEAWFKAAGYNGGFQLKRFTAQNERTPEENLPEVVQQEIEAVSKWYDKFDDTRLKQKVLKGEYFSELITPEVYKKIQDGQFLCVNDFIEPYPKEVIDWMNEQQKEVRHELGIQNPTWQDKINLFVATEQYKYQKKLQYLLKNLREVDKYDDYDINRTVSSFLRHLQNERFIPTGELQDKEIGYTKREPVSILDMEEFIKEKTGHDLNKLHQLRQDVQSYVSSLETDAWLKNEEIKKTSKDEYFLIERDFWKREYEKALDELSDIGKLRVQILKRWIDEKKVSDDELELREQFNDDVVDVISSKQAYEQLATGEGEHYSDTSILYSFLRMIDNEIQHAENGNNESTINSSSNEKEKGSLRPIDWNIIFNRMNELTDEGHSALDASKIVEKEIKGVRKAGTIRNKYKGYY